MNNKYYSPETGRAEKVRELFATIAHRYDLLNDLMSAGLHRRWKQRLVALAQTAPQILDLCCGTGDITARLARADPQRRVVGLDFTMEMLEVARERRSLPGRPSRVLWARGDALQLPFAADSFDVVTVGYGLRNLADLERGLAEIRRVLRPSGRLLSLDFGKPDSPVWRGVYFQYLRFVLPLLGRAFCGDPDTHGYILPSLRDYPAQRGLQALMETGGYDECGWVGFLGGAMAINYGRKIP